LSVATRRLVSSDATKAVTTTEEEPNIVPVDTVSGAPEELRERTVRVFRPARTASQQGTQDARLWKIDFDILEGSARWENPLMGWASSADTQQALTMKFASKEDAIRFAERQGWNYYVQEPKETKFRKKVYADNYKYSPGKLRMVKTK